ncbi:MAG: hypothetical protein C5B60_05245 [Chloroflexi bacterium]|nr:MAG: hypothetical protein C5B60_05245 [Chloroflexota bacterium]
MKAIQLLHETAHRPYPLPIDPWVMRQTWSDLLFAHWPVAPDVMREHLPAGLPLDTFDDQAWLGVVPFRMTGIRPRGVPNLPLLSRTDEINLRTYTVADGKPGVFFFSLDAGSPLAVILARRFFHLPYFNARFTIRYDGDTVDYASHRTHRGAPPGEFAATYRPTGPVFEAAPASLERWLTERYCMYAADRRGRLYRGDIHHRLWPLQPAVADIRNNTLPQGFGFSLSGEPLLHFAARLEVLIWTLARLSYSVG